MYNNDLNRYDRQKKMGILSSVYDYIFLKDTDVPQYLNSSSRSSFDESESDDDDAHTSTSKLYRISESSDQYHNHKHDCEYDNNSEEEKEYDNRIQVILENLKKMDEEYKIVHVKREYTFPERVHDILQIFEILEADLESLYEYVNSKIDKDENENENGPKVSDNDSDSYTNGGVYSQIDLDID